MSNSALELECPICHETFQFMDEINTIEDIGLASFDCPYCGEVLVIRDGAPVSLFEEMKLEFPGIERCDFGYIEVPE